MKENFVDRLLKFVDDNGGVYEVAGNIDVSPQTFYTMKRRGSLPNLSLIYALKEKYINLDLDWLLLGKREAPPEREVDELKERLRRAETIIDSLTGMALKKAKGATTCPGVKKHRKAWCAQVMSVTHRPKKFIYTPGRVQESKYASLIAGYGQGVRLQ